MAAYKDLIGQKITKVTSNPSEPKTGQMWYNSTTQSLKALGIIEAMTSGTSMSNTRGQNGTAHNGTQNAALSVAGNNQGGPLVNNNSEEYNGSGWTSGGTYPISSFGTYGSGVQTAALFSGGRTGSPPFPVTNTSASYNGTSFGAEGNLNQARQSAGCFGATENASIAAGGHNAPGNYTDTEEYNGSAWTTVPATFPSQDNMGAAGVQTAGIANTQGGTGTFLFDGSTWTGGPSMNTARSSLNQAMMGLTQDAVVALGANPSANNAIENYDGTSWTTSTATLGTGRAQSASSGSNTAGVLFGGTTTAYVAVTEEYNRSGNVITAAAWSSGTNYPGNIMYAGSAGNKNAAVVFGGSTAPPSSSNRTAATNNYDGTSWTGGGAMPGVTMLMANLGTQTAAGSFGGTIPTGDTNISSGYEYDGSSWTSGGSIGSAGYSAAGFGTQTAGVIAGGSGDTDYAATYDGSSWTAKNNLSTGRYYCAGTGTTTAGIVMGGQSPPGARTANTETFDGTSWTEVGNLITAKRSQSGGGDSATDALLWAGYVGSDSNTMEGYDGTSWSTRPSLAISKRNRAGSGGSTNAIATGGINPVVNSVEEFTGETTSLNVKTLTQS